MGLNRLTRYTLTDQPPHSRRLSGAEALGRPDDRVFGLAR